MQNNSNKLLLLISIIVYLIFATNIPLINELSWSWSDYKTTLRNSNQNQKYDEIVIVAIDDESLSQIPEKYPWNRRRLAKVIYQLKKNGSKLIILDDYIQSPSSIDPKQDEILASVFIDAKNVITRNYLRRFINHKGENKLQLAPPIPMIKRASKGLGFIDYKKDDFLRLRNLILSASTKNKTHQSMIVSILEHLKYKPLIHQNILSFTKTNKTHSIQLDENNAIPVDLININKNNSKFSRLPFKVFSFVDIQENKIAKEKLKGKIVFIIDANDLSSNLMQTQMNLILPEGLITATILGNILHNHSISYNNRVMFHIILILALFISILFALKSTPVIFTFYQIILPIIILPLDYFLYTSFQVQSSLLIAILATLTFWLLFNTVKYFQERAEKAEIKNAFSHYVTASVVNEILKDTSRLKLGGERKELTVFFSDIANFTNISERLEIERLVTLLNDYLTAMTDNIIIQNKGMLDKYEGDAIMAVFGAPINNQSHAVLACRSALDNQRILKEELWPKWKIAGFPLFTVRIGINTGPMIVGNMGSKTRFDYTVIGDNVNLGSRLENLNKVYKTDILISETTYQLVKNDMRCRMIDVVRVKGKRIPVRVYELISLQNKSSDAINEFIKIYEKAFDLYENKDFKQSIEILEQIKTSCRPKDEASKLLLQRCHQYLQKPPPEDWDNVFEFLDD
ncbi:MAG: hypothetical protein COB02_05805 [Candidatus Cloacimonadota bacterium]|nr:MAG: hypothetical protein COB02_05805 [Candidatus Cloacimonadota bacterium]